MKRFIVVLLILALVAAAILGAAYAFLAKQDHELVRARVESALENALGREVHLGRPLEIAITPSPVIRVHNARLGNAVWSDEATMLTIESIDLRPGFRSLLKGEIVLRDLYLRGARLRLENGPDGRGNWQFDVAEDDGDDPLPVEIRSLSVTDLNVAYVTASGEVRELRVDELSMGAATPDAEIGVRLAGEALGLPLGISGSIGRFTDLVAGLPFDLDLDASLGESGLAVTGRILDPDFRDFQGIELAFEAAGKRPVLLMEWTDVGIPELDQFEVSGRVIGQSGHLSVSDFSGQFEAPDYSMIISGDVEHVPDMSGMSLEFDARSGKIAQLLPWRDTPVIVEGEFAAQGRVTGDLVNPRLDPVRLTAEIAGSTLSIEGSLSDFASGGVLQADVSLRSPSPEALGETILISLPPVGTFDLDGTISGTLTSPALSGVTARVTEGSMSAKFTGDIGDLVALGGIALTVELGGGNAEDLDDLFGIEGLPYTERVNARGLLRGDRSDLTLVVDNARLEAGEVELQCSGQVQDLVDAPRLDLAMRLSGEDLRILSPETEELVPPTDSYAINGRLTGPALAPDLVDVDARARIGKTSLALTGKFPDVLNLNHIDTRFQLEGEDLSIIGAHFDRVWPRSKSFRFKAHASGPPDGPRIEELDGLMETDELRLRIAGRIGDLIAAEGIDIEVQATAESLVPFLPWGGRLWEALGESTAAFSLRGGVPTFQVDLASLTAGRSSLQGRFELSLDEAGDISGIVGSFTESALDLTPWLDYGDETDKPGQPQEKPPDRPVFPDRPIPLGWLSGLTLDVDLKAVDLTFGEGVLNVRSGELDVADSIMTIDPFEVVFRGSLIEGGLQFDARGTPKLASRMHSNGFDLGDLARQAGLSDVARGLVDVELTVDAVGNSVQQLAGSADGHFGLLMTEGFLGEAALNLHLSSIITTLMPFVKEQQGFNVRCGMIDLSIASGIATSNLLVLDTEDMLMKGSGTLDLGRERYNLFLKPRPKRARALAHNVNVRVTGPFRNPRISYDARAAGVRALGTLGRFALLGPAGLFVSPDTFRETRQDCAETLEQVARIR
jgi:uncharacterized protein involved in outer membrane biogenesis